MPLIKAVVVQKKYRKVLVHSMRWTQNYGTKEIDVMDSYERSQEGIQSSYRPTQVRSEARTNEPDSLVRAQRIDVVFGGVFVSDPRRDVEIDIDYDTGDGSYVRVAIRDEKPRGRAGGDWTWLDMNPDDANKLAEMLMQASTRAGHHPPRADHNDRMLVGSATDGAAQRDRMATRRLREVARNARNQQPTHGCESSETASI